MRILVTGGAGFIGSTLVDRLLDDGHNVDVVDDLSSGSFSNLERAASSKHAFTFTELDVRSDTLIAYVEERRPEVIVHLAAQISVARSVESPHLDADVNVLGTLRVLDAARAGEVRKVLFAASAAIYGNVEEADLPIVEARPQRPTSPYGISKAVAISYLMAYGELYDLDWTALVLANVYGPRQRADGEGGVVAVFATNLAAGDSIEIHGDGAQQRDFVHVEDVADAFVRALGSGGRSVLNIATGKAVSVNELYEAMATASGATAPPRRVAGRPGDIRASRLDATAALDALGWMPRTSLEAGLRSLLAALR